MKKIISFALLLSFLALGNSCQSQDKSKRPSAPAIVKQQTASGAALSIDYSRPLVKGRVIGKDLEPKDGQVWRTGANEATVFETSKAIKVEGKDLPAGKYALFTISGTDSWTIIFNKTWKQWGAYDYKEADDALRVSVTPQKSATFAEKMTFEIDKTGLVTLLWGDHKVSFKTK